MRGRWGDEVGLRVALERVQIDDRHFFEDNPARTHRARRYHPCEWVADVLAGLPVPPGDMRVFAVVSLDPSGHPGSPVVILGALDPAVASDDSLIDVLWRDATSRACDFPLTTRSERRRLRQLGLSRWTLRVREVRYRATAARILRAQRDGWLDRLPRFEARWVTPEDVRRWGGSPDRKG